MATHARCFTLAAVGCAWASIAPAPHARAGDLDPPPGLVAETMLPLDEVEPRAPLGPDDLPIIIGQPGSYFLTDNLVATGFGQDAITISSPDVTLDMRGFAIMGSEVGVWDNGIVLDPVVTNISISNGAITDVVVHGIAGSQVDGCTVERLRIVDSNSIGLLLDENSIVRHCIVTGSGSGGIRCDGNAVIVGCIAEQNGSIGIQGGAGSIVSACSAESNESSGITVGASSSVTNCASNLNTSFGFFSSGGACTVVGCTAEDNGASGYSMGGGTLHESCVASSNDTDGIGAKKGGIVRNCTAHDNDRHGITVADASLVVGNICDNNGLNDPNGAGIFIGGAVNDARIDGNTVTNNDIGIDLEGFDNLVIKNHAAGNANNFDFGPGNVLGPILTTANMNSNAHPHGNFDSN